MSDTPDHPACKHRCQRSLEVSEFPFPRVCPEGECQHACHDQGKCLRPTPEIDAEAYETDRGDMVVSVNLARQICVQLAEARAKAARLQMELDASCNAEELRQVREENARLREALEKSKEFVQSWGELIDAQYPLWNECMATIQKALTP